MLLALLAGCATKKPVQKNYLFFPAAPDEPRIQYLMSFGAESDLGGGVRQVRSIPDNGRIVATQFRLKQQEPSGANFLNCKASKCRTGDGDGVDVLVRRQFLRGGVISRQNI